MSLVVVKFHPPNDVVRVCVCVCVCQSSKQFGFSQNILIPPIHSMHNSKASRLPPPLLISSSFSFSSTSATFSSPLSISSPPPFFSPMSSFSSSPSTTSCYAFWFTSSLIDFTDLPDKSAIVDYGWCIHLCCACRSN